MCPPLALLRPSVGLSPGGHGYENNNDDHGNADDDDDVDDDDNDDGNYKAGDDGRERRRHITSTSIPRAAIRPLIHLFIHSMQPIVQMFN